ncbi:MAG: pyridoxal-phosphate dependent enzyme, partial [Phycisphaerae bacterium]
MVQAIEPSGAAVLHNSDDYYPLFDAVPALRRTLPRIALGAWPTPATPLTRFGGALNLPQLWIKRDDASDPVAGGNKLRGLELLLADAIARGFKSILTLGAAGSFHVRATAAAADRLGLRTFAVLTHQPRSAYVRRNLTIAHAAGAQLRAAWIPALPIQIARSWLDAVRAERGRPYLIPPGGSSPLAGLSFINAAFELRRQIDAGALPEPKWLFVPLGSLGTAAGLALGCRLAGLKTRVVGIVVFSRWYCTRGRWARMANRMNRLLSRRGEMPRAADIRATDLTVIADALGRGYA